MTRSWLKGCQPIHRIHRWEGLGALLRAAGVLGLIVATGAGCKFDRSGLPLPPQYVGSCSATIRGLDGDGTEFYVENADPEFGDRLLATWCITGPGSDEIKIRQEWERHLADVLGAADFRGQPGPWCIVEGSVRCELGDEVDKNAFPSCPPPLSAPLLGYCPDPPDPACLLVDPLLDFGPVSVGESRVAPLEISNSCNAREIGVRAGESIMGPQADEFEIVDNRCPPPPGEDFRSLAPAGSPGDRCDVDVSFLPISPLTRSAEYRLLEEPSTSVAVDLRGEGVGAIAKVSPASMCLGGPLSGADLCTPHVVFRIENPGPGGIRVVDGVLDPTDTGFRVIRPPTPEVGSFISQNTDEEVWVEWCQGLSSSLAEEATYSLTLTSDTAANDTFDLGLKRPCP